MEIRIWTPIYGSPYMDINIWTSTDGAVYGYPYIVKPLWIAIKVPTFS